MNKPKGPIAKAGRGPARAARRPANDPAATTMAETPAVGFPIVGIGASAGGLEALELFLAQVPPASGMALVVVQHLDPNHKDLMVELLQRTCPLPVVQISDRLPVAPDHVYVLPPNHDLALRGGCLCLLKPAGARGLRLPIDTFFLSLAEAQQHRSIGVVLSGMGSDGTAGARAIKEKGGAVFVQAAAKFDAMPRSVLDAGLADRIAPAAALAAELLAYIHHIPLLAGPASAVQEELDQSGLEKVIHLLRVRNGHDFTFYKKSTLYRRIERRMALHQLARIADYARFLRENPQESDLLFREMLIGVTHFFRDPEAWEQLRSKVIPDLLAARPDGGALRAWCPGCSSGEEAYSLAICFREAQEQAAPAAHYTLQIFATDLDKDAIDKARAGAYPPGALDGVSEPRRRRFFNAEERGYRVTKEIREMVIFAPQNLVMDPPFTRLDLLLCRNLLIYLEPGLQKRLMPLFHYSLNPGGCLMLGSSESVGQASELFAPLPGKTRLFQRLDAVLGAERVEFPSAFSAPPRAAKAAPGTGAAPEPRLNLQALTDGLLLSNYAPAAVLTTASGDIIYFSGKTGKFLEPAAGKANLNVFAMAREGLRGTLYEAFARAVRQQATLELPGITVGTNGGTQQVDVTIQVLTEPAKLQGMVLIVFAEAATPAPAAAAATGKESRHAGRLAELTLEFQRARDEMQTIREEMQSSQEELRSANEELQSTNEELQSTNEELTTSKEEMQSMNEELQTINHELQAKVEELSQAKDDMANLLNSIEIATLFLDQELRVRRFTAETTSLIKLIPGDAGRPITDLGTELDYPTLAADAREVLRTLIPHEQQAPTRDGRHFTVRIMPYRTQDNRIAGVVITFLDVTGYKTLEAAQLEALGVLRGQLSLRAGAARAEELEAALRQAEATLTSRLDGSPAPAVPGRKPPKRV